MLLVLFEYSDQIHFIQNGLHILSDVVIVTKMSVSRSKIYASLSAEERTELGKEEIKEIMRIRENQIFRGMTKGLAGAGYRLDDVSFERALKNAINRVSARKEQQRAQIEELQMKRRQAFENAEVEAHNVLTAYKQKVVEENTIDVVVVFSVILILIAVLALLVVHAGSIQHDQFMLDPPY